MANLKDVIYLSAEDYNTLYTNGTVTINGTTITYDANNVYIVPDDTDEKISTALANYIAKSNTSGLVKNDGSIDTNTYATTSQLPSTMGASGSSHAGGLVPDTPSTSGTTKYLREDGSWQTPPNTTYSASDFDIKDLSDSTSLRTKWSGKQDKYYKTLYSTQAYSGNVNLLYFSNKTYSSLGTNFIVSLSTNWENYSPRCLVAVVTTMINTTPIINYLTKSDGITGVTITMTNNTANGLLTLNLNSQMQGIIYIQVTPLSDIDIEWQI